MNRCLFIRLLGIGCYLLGLNQLMSQVFALKATREKWTVQTGASALPLVDRFSVFVAGMGLQSAELASPAITNRFSGTSFSLTFNTNFLALAIPGMPPASNAFDHLYPGGTYRLAVANRTITSRTNIYNLYLTNDFPTVAPILANAMPFSALPATQLFTWPVFASDTAGFTSFILLEGQFDLQIIQTLLDGGFQVPAGVDPLVSQLQLVPSLNQVSVSNINPRLDHLAILQFHQISPMEGEPVLIKDVGNVCSTVVFYPSGAVRITTPPRSQTVKLGYPVAFDVMAVGTPPLSYQWQHNGTNLPGATNLVYANPVVQTAHAGAYTVVISNLSGSITNEPAILKVVLPPAPTLVKPVLSTNHIFQFFCQQDPGVEVSIEASTNLTTWEVIATWTSKVSENFFTDPNATNFTRRFYRAVPTW